MGSGQSQFTTLKLRSVPSEESRSSTPRYGFAVFHLGAKYQRTPPERAAPVFQYLDSPTRIVIVFAISCQYDNSRPRHHAVANHQAYYAVLSRRLYPTGPCGAPSCPVRAG